MLTLEIPGKSRVSGRMRTAPNRERQLSPGPNHPNQASDWRATVNGTRTCSVPGCSDLLSSISARGMCRPHYSRFLNHGDPLGGSYSRRRGRSTAERFWSYVEKGPGCWEWTGNRSVGYGQMKINGSMIYAHRWSYEDANGPIPDGLVIDHMCMNPPCVRPDHLRAVPPDVNAKNRSVPANSKTGVNGVTLHYTKSGAPRYRASINRDRKAVHLGTFATLDEAAKVATEARQREYQLPDFAALGGGEND